MAEQNPAKPQVSDEDLLKELEELQQQAAEINKGKKEPEPEPKPTDMPEKKKKSKEAKPRTPQEQLADFKKEFKLEDNFFPEEFKNLSEAQQLKVIQDLQRRIVDIVKSDAQTQYSKDAQSKKGIKDIFGKISISINKESEVRGRETQIFRAIRDTEEGKKLIAENLAQLTEVTKERTVTLVDGKPQIDFFKSPDGKEPTAEEKNFNKAANAFREIPYEWGQEKSGKHRKGYDEAKASYDQATNALIVSEQNKEGGKAAAIAKMLQLDHLVQMDQLINTHPEFEKEITRLSEDKGKAMAQAQDVWNLGGKGRLNKTIFAGGIAFRFLAKGAAIVSGLTGATLGAAAIAGGVVGAVRGRVKAKQSLEERKEQARHGQKDISKEKSRMVDVVLLTKGLDRMTQQAENAAGPEEKAKVLSKLAVVIEHSRNQVEKGQVNFGDSRSSLANEYNFINSLNKALVIQQANAGQNDAELKKKIDAFLLKAETEGRLVKGVSESQRKFVNDQTKKGFLIGMGFASAGYVLHLVTEKVSGLVHEYSATVENPNAGPALTRPDITPGQPSHGPTLGKEFGRREWMDDKLAPKVPSGGPGQPPPGPVAPSVNTFTEGVKFNDGKGATQGILDLKNQMRAHYHNDFSQAPKSIQDFMKETNVTKQAIDLRLYRPDEIKESALIWDEAVLKFDEQGNLRFGVPDKAGNIPVLQEYKGPMFDYDSSGISHRPDTEGSMETRVETSETTPGLTKAIDDYLRTATEPSVSGQFAGAEGADSGLHTTAGTEAVTNEQAAALKNLGFTGDLNDRNAINEFLAKGRVGAAREAVMQKMSAQPLRPGDILIENGTPVRVTSVGEGGVNVEYGPLDPNLGHGVHRSGDMRVINLGRGHFADLSPRDNHILMEHPEFAHRYYHDLSGKDLLKAYQAGHEKIESIFNHETSPSWRDLKNDNAESLLKFKDPANVSSSKGQLADYLRDLEEASGLKPKMGWHGFRFRMERTGEYMARALQKLATEPGKLEEFKSLQR